MAQALINHRIIPWACHRADMDLDFLASKMKFNVEKLREWESGESKPTFKQAQKLAKYLHIQRSKLVKFFFIHIYHYLLQREIQSFAYS